MTTSTSRTSPTTSRATSVTSPTLVQVHHRLTISTLLTSSNQGCPGIETRVPLLFNYGLMMGRISPEKFVQLTSTNAAKLYGIYPKVSTSCILEGMNCYSHCYLKQKGALLPGLSDADLTIWYPDGKLPPFTLKNLMLHHNVDCR